MLGHLAKLAARSAQLRKIAMTKQALLGSVVKGVGGAIVRNPGKALTVGMLGAVGGGEAIKKTKELNQGFNPQSPQQQLAGPAPRPPGA